MVLKGNKVKLRPLTLADAPRFVKWFNDPEVNKFLFRRSMTLPAERKWLKEVKKKIRTEKVFAIEAKNGTHIGSTGLHIKSQRDRRADFGIMIGDKRYWNRGFGTEAVRLILNYGFRKLKLHRIELDVYAYNPRAIKVYKRLGFKSEGTRREHVFYNGKFYDTFHMAILDREWQKRTKDK